MSPKLHEFLVILRRKNEGTPWGIRLVGGSDLNAPLIITKVSDAFLSDDDGDLSTEDKEDGWVFIFN